MILSELDSIVSLKSAVLTCNKIWRAGTANQVAKIVLFRQLDENSVRAQALATWHIRRLPQPAPESQTFHYLMCFLASEIECPSLPSLTLTDAGEIERLSLAICDLSTDFIQDCLSELLRVFKHTDSDQDYTNSATSTEKTRIQRAFYLAEMYYTTSWPPLDRRTVTMRPANFWECLAAWEIEILA